MDLTGTFKNASKLDSRLLMALDDLDEKTDRDAPLFDVLVSVKDASRPLPPLAGVEVHTGTGPVRTAGNVTLNGLEKLADEGNVRRIEGSRLLYESAAPKLVR